jgi:hypothetical protein
VKFRIATLWLPNDWPPGSGGEGVCGAFMFCLREVAVCCRFLYRGAFVWSFLVRMIVFLYDDLCCIRWGLGDHFPCVIMVSKILFVGTTA